MKGRQNISEVAIKTEEESRLKKPELNEK